MPEISSRPHAPQSRTSPYARTLATGRILVVLLATAAPALAQAVAVAPHSDPAPSELASPIRDLMATGGSQVTVNGSAVDFWWVKSTTAAPAVAGAAWPLAEGTLVGAVRFSATFRDIRGRVLKPGVYTLRYGIQPANGDHMGVSPHRDFLLLSPAAVDGTPAPAGHDGSVDLSRQAIGSSHPAILAIDPPSASETVGSVRSNDLGHTAVVFEIPATPPIRFGLVLVGKIDA
jgi:hypothetical protein